MIPPRSEIVKAHRLGLGLLICLLVGFGLENCSERKQATNNWFAAFARTRSPRKRKVAYAAFQASCNLPK